MARCDENDSGNACVVVHIQGWTLPVLPLRQPISFFLSFSFLLILRLLLLFPTSSSSSSISSSSSSSSLSFFLFLFNLLLRPSFFDCSLVDAGWFLSFIEFRTTLVTFFSGWTGFGWSHSTPFLFDFSLFLYYFISFSFILFLWLSLRRLSFGFRLMRLDSSCWNFCWNFFARFPAILQTPSCEEKQQTNTQERTSRLNFFLSLFLSSVRLDPIRTDTILLDRIKISHGGKILLLRDRGSGRKVLHDPWQITNWRWSSIFETVVSRFNPLDLNSMKTWSESLSLSLSFSLFQVLGLKMWNWLLLHRWDNRASCIEWRESLKPASADRANPWRSDRFGVANDLQFHRLLKLIVAINRREEHKVAWVMVLSLLDLSTVTQWLQNVD